jgi:hypothetical protein
VLSERALCTCALAVCRCALRLHAQSPWPRPTPYNREKGVHASEPSWADGFVTADNETRAAARQLVQQEAPGLPGAGGWPWLFGSRLRSRRSLNACSPKNQFGLQRCNLPSVRWGRGCRFSHRFVQVRPCRDRQRFRRPPSPMTADSTAARRSYSLNSSRENCAVQGQLIGDNRRTIAR